MVKKRHIMWRHILTYGTLAALALLVYFSREQIGETISNLGRINALILVMVLIWQVVNYHSYAKLYQLLFRILGAKKISYKNYYKVSLELTFVNHVFPSAGLSGFSYFGLRMKQLGATPAQATLVQTMRFITVFITMLPLLLFAVFAMSIEGRASNFTIMVASMLSTLLVVGTLLLAYIVGSRRRIDGFFTVLTKGTNKVVRTVLPRFQEAINVSAARKLFFEFHDNYVILKDNYKKLKMPLVYALLSTVTEIMTLYTVYLAFGENVNIGAVIIAYAVANFAGLISVLPGGIGVYEALMTAVLITAGVPPSVSLPVTVMYRVVTMIIQLPIGYYFYHRAVNHKAKPFL